jgi:hypothetical protein
MTTVYFIGPKGSVAKNSFRHATPCLETAKALLATIPEGEMKVVDTKAPKTKGAV